MVKKPDLSIKNNSLYNPSWPLRLNQTVRAKRLSIRVSPVRREVIVTYPPSFKMRDVEKFIARHQGWIDEKIQRSGSAAIEAPHHGSVISFMGHDYVIQYQKSVRVNVWRGEGILKISCAREEDIPHVIGNWIRSIAPYELQKTVDHYASLLEVRYASIRIKDTKSQWGSCHPEGHLCFSWRLLLAPMRVIEYLIVHELSHLKEANHSTRFWSYVESLCPDFKVSKKWLKSNGPKLFGWG